MELFEELLLDALFAIVAAIGFAVISNPPKKAIFFSALLAAISHSTRFYLMRYLDMDITISSFAVAAMVGLMSIFFAQLIKCPAEVFSFPSLLPMIPGVFAYKTILAVIQFMRCTDQSQMQLIMIDIFHNGFTTFFVLSALAIGVSLPLFAFKKLAYSTTRQKQN